MTFRSQSHTMLEFSSIDTPLVFACLLAITIFTSAGIGFVVLIEELAFAWRPSRRE